jgi:hypothetical protein
VPLERVVALARGVDAPAVHPPGEVRGRRHVGRDGDEVTGEPRVARERRQHVAKRLLRGGGRPRRQIEASGIATGGGGTYRRGSPTPAAIAWRM